MDSDPPSAKPEPQKEEPPPPKPKERPKLEDLSHFQLFCDNILRKLVMKDPEGYFANPVSEYFLNFIFGYPKKQLDALMGF